MRRQLIPALMMTLALTVLTGLVYPLAVTGVSRALFPDRAAGSLVSRGGEVVGSSLLGQAFIKPEYFHPRPSVPEYDALASGGSNLGPTNPDLLSAVEERVTAYRELNDLGPDEEVPVDAVTASGSGLDPHISVANARLQTGRVAAARSLSVAAVLALVERHTQGRQWGFLGEKVVNVLELNLDLDRRAAAG